MDSILESAYADAAAADAAEDPVFTDPNLDIDAGQLYGPQIDLSWLKAKTGPGTIESYIDHPLNTSKSRGVAQILRGATGLAGDLDLAVIDIGLGLVEVIKEKRVSNGQAFTDQSRQ